MKFMNLSTKTNAFKNYGQLIKIIYSVLKNFCLLCTDSACPCPCGDILFFLLGYLGRAAFVLNTYCITDFIMLCCALYGPHCIDNQGFI